MDNIYKHYKIMLMKIQLYNTHNPYKRQGRQGKDKIYNQF